MAPSPLPRQGLSGGQYNKKYLKEFTWSFQRREMFLFLTFNIAAMMSSANQQLFFEEMK